MSGAVLGIFITPIKAAALQACGEVRAIPGKGLEGDRYFSRAGTHSRDTHEPDRELTLIEAEVLDALASEHGISLAPAESRRNIVTRGVELNTLVGVEFSVGEVRVRGIRLCEPCAHLERLTGKKLVKQLVHKSGLCAAILTPGTIRLGDAVTLS